ncbi:insulinase family protein [Candidatus Falkowbacteria bacterium]|nr:insulinase family protein [Candidatus Falkowbacteria bacterium]
MHKLHILKDDLRVLTIPMRATQTATVLVVMGTGSKYEDKHNNGISHFLEHMFFKGTAKRPNALDINEELDAIGGVYNAFTSKEYTGYLAKVDAAKLPVALDVVSDMLINSKFDAAEIEREKGVIKEEINMYLDNPMAHLDDVFEECLYGDQPAGWETIGTKKNIAAFRREDFLNYFNSQYGRQNTIICLVGNIGEDALEMTEKYFSRLKVAEFKDKLAVEEEQSSPQILVHKKKTDQAHLSLGVRSYAIGHKDEFVLRIMSAILGGSMSSRLFSELREKRGLAYYVHADAEFYTDSGYLSAFAGVPIDKIDEAIKIILDEYKEIKETPIGERELKRVKDLIHGRTVIFLEGSENVAGWYGRQMILTGKVSAPEDYFKKINAVTAEDIKRVARDIFVDAKLNLAVIGPYEGEREFIKTLKLS